MHSKPEESLLKKTGKYNPKYWQGKLLPVGIYNTAGRDL